jgi:hypothetical protein
LLLISAEEELVGKQVEWSFKYKHEKGVENRYDFLKSSVNGLEERTQYYVFENSLKKLKVDLQAEQVEWTEKDYNEFMKKHKWSCS